MVSCAATLMGPRCRSGRQRRCGPAGGSRCPAAWSCGARSASTCRRTLSRRWPSHELDPSVSGEAVGGESCASARGAAGRRHVPIGRWQQARRRRCDHHHARAAGERGPGRRRGRARSSGRGARAPRAERSGVAEVVEHPTAPAQSSSPAREGRVKHNRYRFLTKAEKERRSRESLREPPIRCPVCEAAIQPDDLLMHQAERCQGRPAPHPRSRWITWGEVRRLGVPAMSISRWTRKGWIRVRRDDVERPRKRGRPSATRYNLRDVVQLVAQRRRISTTRVTKSRNRQDT
jgi:hypothetical protein